MFITRSKNSDAPPFPWKSWEVLLPLALAIVIVIFSPFVDIPVSSWFYGPEGFSHNPFFQWIYEDGVIPGLLLAGISVLVYLLSFVAKPLKKWRKGALLTILTLVIGAGFIVHTVLKDHWGRPRPKQTLEFGGSQPYRPIYSPNFFHQPQPSRSFPCGHCTMGFFFFALYVVGKREQNAWLKYSGLFLAVVLGFLLSLARIAQGGHFLSDTLMTAIILWLTVVCLEYLIYDAG